MSEDANKNSNLIYNLLKSVESNPSRETKNEKGEKIPTSNILVVEASEHLRNEENPESENVYICIEEIADMTVKEFVDKYGWALDKPV